MPGKRKARAGGGVAQAAQQAAGEEEDERPEWSQEEPQPQGAGSSSSTRPANSHFLHVTKGGGHTPEAQITPRNDVSHFGCLVRIEAPPCPWI
jgi:hypothetical protein